MFLKKSALVAVENQLGVILFEIAFQRD